ncbi:MBL fold metallo-hydrolase [Sphingobacterium sp. 2149]|uniref:ComEC/Rec2 family competence protein n=1 Tax=Sphingobacterium sp. 2149 TaxID=2817763 RepID=UPI00286796DA|nr:MBL fold metallo-hydrolase [Sphingobacterium sp. 2149]MDR6734827.1 beta-lactamase superfamily II metal-dependent hydrolase [Sphingobacterium sp. 2149]
MEIKIEMPNIGDGDAIIVHLKRGLEDLVVLIDGGNAKDADKVIQKLDPILTKTGKSGPDLVICTHYDSDHIGGLKKIAQHYQNKIGTVWVHKPNIEDLQKTISTSNDLLQHRKSEEVNALKQLFLLEENYSSFQNVLLESYNDMAEFVDFLINTSIPTIEPFTGCQYPGWEEVIMVLGPSESFYKTLLPNLKNSKSQIGEQLLYESFVNKPRGMKTLMMMGFPCQTLDKTPKAQVTTVNQSSIIISIVVNRNKFLFTGDAAINSFKEIPGYPDTIKDIFWLKVAHHGSRNNSSSELFNIMRPKYAFVSGDRHIDQEVIDCLKEKSVNVKTTRDDNDLSFKYP